MLNQNIKPLKIEAEPEKIKGIGEKFNLIFFIGANLGFEINLESIFPNVTNYLLKKNFRFRVNF